MYYEKKLVKDPIQSTFNDLKLFEQNNFCREYLKKNFDSINNDKLKHHSEIAAASFRQASEYYKAASSASINTSPLLFSYALNNLLKGVCYLKSIDSELLKGFKSHGFVVEDSQLKRNAIKSKIKIKNSGAVQSLLMLFNNRIVSQEIDLYKLLRHIPNISDYYYKSVGSISLVAEEETNEEEQYIFKGSTVDHESMYILKNTYIMFDINKSKDICWSCFTWKTQQYISDGTFNQNDIFYKRFLILPEKFKDGIKSINVSFYCYLLIMSYGMMVRYNANIWENYIDKKKSTYATLIEVSISNAVLNFYYQMHYLLFGYYYENESYNEIEIRHIIDKSTVDIMNNIAKKLKNDSFLSNSYGRLPWKDSIR